MIMDLIDSIKQVAHRAAESYLLTGASMNDTIFQAHIAGEIENDEILKRICEQANQNVYLSLFNDATIDKSNIKFEMADWNEILSNIKQRESEMKEYDAPPTDFRASLPDITSNEEPTMVHTSAFKKLGALNQLVDYHTRVNQFEKTLESMRVSEVSAAEEAFIKMSHDAKLVVANGESLGDMAKIAARFAVEMGVGFEKVATAYGIIQESLRQNGFAVNAEFTKLSSLKVNDSSQILAPVKSFVLAIEKAAALKEMREGVHAHRISVSKIIGDITKTA